ncbi:MAG: hypothetical protein A2648_00440 [Candidatus Lloydbacteria bacterium RIFCSPHIGHO2_01_FULL_41_20]|uniref:tRNA/rRNA methyltransferase SpoU type domain-containing protein n=1 Tax=Candidatus Lloydbacteria bacterium RIFCSPHIGHO2_01_FULL_41_20 TaxID=1798657 RepID=A0A1G2CSA3_9BACT|nr:MAG: hypothetical protein A2648_00440 [Candidatus Lloydbacteria bacterium RIFCSPHIGHO2_01_FULL_41_20]
MSRNRNVIYLILHDIRSVHNVGAIFRTAEGAGVSRIILSGYTPGPLDRFGRERSDFKKSALGAEKLVSFEQTYNISATLSDLKKKRFYIIALEQDKNAVDYKKVKIKNKTAVLVGNEVRGIPKNILKKCDIVAEIPMRGKLARNRRRDDVGKESLNISVAVGIALFRFFDL